ncbi:phage tail fiber protein [Micromonospora sp. CA-240977]|uniref:phage tail fiber protein n=1 Tax=Micromonospora sp. CA-240977 TaxID=3239957 RepID=UPI003D8D1753
MPALTQTEANRLLDATLGTSAHTAPTTPIRLALVTANGSATAAGTEVTGGSYLRQTVTMAAASAGGAANSGTVTFSGLSVGTIVGAEIWDSAGSPRRLYYGALSAPKAVGARFPDLPGRNHRRHPRLTRAG